MPRGYWLKVRLSTIPLAFPLCYLVGLRGVLLFAGFAVSTPIVGACIIQLWMYLFPPTIERYLPSGSLGLGV
jgi:hypothetical protein